MPKNTNYYSVSRAQWQHIGFDSVHKIRRDKQANQNETNNSAEVQQEKAAQLQHEMALEE